VYVDDPLFSQSELRALGYTPLLPEFEGEIDAIILQAGHQAYQAFDFGRFARCQVILDGRRALNSERIKPAGIRYITIGDGYREKPAQERHKQPVVSSMLQSGGE